MPSGMVGISNRELKHGIPTNLSPAVVPHLKQRIETKVSRGGSTVLGNGISNRELKLFDISSRRGVHSSKASQTEN